MTAARRPEPLAALLRRKVITEDQAGKALAYARQHNRGLPSALISLGFCTVEEYQTAIVDIGSRDDREEAQAALRQLLREMGLDADAIVRATTGKGGKP